MTPTPLKPVRTVAPTEVLLSLADAKLHLKIEASDVDNDAYITGLCSAAEAHLDGFAGVLGRALVTQTWRRSFDGFPAGDPGSRSGAGTIRLPLGPLQSVSSVTYYDSDGDSQTLSASAYHAVSDAIGPCVMLADGESWPTTDVRPDAVTVTWVCGHGAAADVPAPIIHAAKLLIGHWFEGREAVNVGNIVNELPLAVEALLAPYRVVPLS